MSSSHRFEINYLFNNEPRAQVVQRDSDEFPLGAVVQYLVALHYDGLLGSQPLPAADASTQQALQQAAAFGISDIRVSKLTRVLTPGHYRQP